MALNRLRFSGHDVPTLQVLDRDELELPFDGPTLFRDIEDDEQVFAEPWAFRNAYRQAIQTFLTASNASAANAATTTFGSSQTIRSGSHLAFPPRPPGGGAIDAARHLENHCNNHDDVS